MLEYTLKLDDKSKKTLKENQEFVDKWVVGLRSGKYTQVKEAMVYPDIPQSCCCLMVAEIEGNGKSWEDGINPGNGYTESYPVPSQMPNGCPWLENLVATHPPTTDFDRCEYQPYNWNDELELSFEDIATLLETGEVSYIGDEDGVKINDSIVDSNEELQ